MIEIDFNKGDGLVPCVVQDIENGQVLMLGYMNEESLQETLRSGLATYWSRSRQELWKKGKPVAIINMSKKSWSIVIMTRSY